MGKLIVIFTRHLLLLLLLTGCLSEPESSSVNESGGLRVGLLSPIYHIKLHSQSDVNFWEIQKILYEPLYARDSKTGELKPRLAEAYEWRNDHKTLYFRLKGGLKWSDDQPLTSDDIEFTLQSHSETKYESMYFGVYSARVERFERLNKSEFLVHFKTASPSNFKALAQNLLVYPKHFYVGSLQGYPPTSGPFVLQSFQPGKSLQLIRSQSWWGQSQLSDWGGIPAITYRWFESYRGLVSAAKSGNIDFFEVGNPNEFLRVEKFLKDASGWAAVRAEGFRLRGRHTLVLNHKNPSLAKSKVRKALQAVSNREMLNEKLFSNMLEVADGPWASDHPAGVKAKSSQRDSNLGQQLKGEFADKELTVLSFVEEFEPFLTIFQQQLKKVGVKITIERQSFSEAMKSFEVGSADAVYIYSPWIPFELSLKAWYQSEDDGNPWTNPGNFSDKTLDALIAKAEQSYSEKERLEIHKEAFVRLSKLVPDLYLYNDKYKLYFISDRVIRPQDTLPFDLGMASWVLK